MIRQRRLLVVAAMVGVAVAITATGSAASPDGVDTREGSFLRVQLSGYQEDPQVLSTAAKGQFRARINDRAQEITYELSYADLSGTITAAHIHFGGKAQSGGISVFLCSNLPNPPAGTQLCPAAPATITGTLKAENVIGPAAQGIAAGEFAEVIAAIRAGVTYVNVHSTDRPAGEVRAQLGHQHR